MPGPRSSRRPFTGRRVVLGVTGGIAAYKAITVARELTLAGAEVDVVLSAGALEFVRPLSFEALTGRPAYSSLYPQGDPLLHIRLARDADLVIIAPATANFLARAAAGMADDLMTAALLATAAPVVLVPAMNDRMYAHPATQGNLARLAEYGYRVAGPAVGPLAWGEGEGPGRMLEPEQIVAHAGRALEGRGALAGRVVVVTAGPTREPIDPVRFIGNRSSGRMGYEIAAAAWRRGAQTILIAGPSHLPVPEGVELRRVETAEQMRAAVAEALPAADTLVMSAAVADFRPANAATDKIKKEAGGVPQIVLEPTADVLRATRDVRPAGCVVVGFALETADVVENGRRKLHGKGLDLLVVNDATEPGAGFEVETNRVVLLQPDLPDEALPLMSKAEVADRILDRVESILTAEPGA
ncbi:bifunctional phosphopantothenoylcysteine decarboxylase/phosphopantothenate--cysteine ligase CoaBC [Longimicrobium terrae]|uniref:Coenzyme A biosynthesis bifunctional protein CoaBC n=1 Tax=Longimicrobium terrae TaxID=1639882 RepID=A0A841H4R7_9BACT|nr:phosphopantothenoylcysteine decarboxylase/phosphopantothenate--cysteine ligase [Longimicrobium terrae]MBB6072974.1 phosphopantothenoylcysteine decarboxylase/phosphopantothenate--cysteine ligase [Longimicrobium terrae]NNC33099.1 bifunctional phosphopantothenoylcysteine decarboxylase/phosphopantothenate--cysteine ligase CoaBC [Longimicrobium terrae]